MRLMFCAIAALLLASPAFAEDKAQDKPKPNTLTAKEIADGWLLLFDGETTFGWTTEGEVKVKDGQLFLDGDKKGASITCTTGFESFELTFDSYTAFVSPNGPTLGVGKLNSRFELEGAPVGVAVKNHLVWDTTKKVGKLTCDAEKRGKPDQPPSVQTRDIPGTGSQLIISEIAGRSIGVRNVKLRPLNTSPLFAGKNLDGWKVNAADPKRMASKWEVTKDGELSLKNGPGDLVTEKEFDNFVLQLECKTLGDGLNSGVFFRCIPGQYQNGYEAQINNAIIDKDRTKPKDAGTGAIYRRIASRKVVSNDNEWFTLTVVADGKHIATWVNGYQTVDWIDDRKEDQNPRKGFRATKGPISLQGHDPTTDILFRNIRIAELPK
ncbi:MAG: DUF1080 domain-containing protein [Gemmataceae bacterium]